MRNLLVIADDFSGAAEIAGIGHRYGFATRLLREPPEQFEPGLTAVDTDSRTLPPAEAADAVRRFTAHVLPADFEFVYKKTDSVLRGPIAAELQVLVKAFARRDALLVPQNPSRGRVIVNGEYFINGTPLHETPFANDPTHPARSSRVAERVPGVRVGDGASMDDLRVLAARLDPSTLPAGGADFFTAILQNAGATAARGPLDQLAPGPTMYVSGTASEASVVPGVTRCARGDSVEQWCDNVCRTLAHASRAAMSIGQGLELGAKAAACAVRRGGIANLLVTGGSTASAVCRELGWTRFDVEGEFAVGVVRLRPNDKAAPAFIVKPGSYPWPPAVLT